MLSAPAEFKYFQECSHKNASFLFFSIVIDSSKLFIILIFFKKELNRDLFSFFAQVKCLECEDCILVLHLKISHQIVASSLQRLSSGKEITILEF